MSQTKTCIIDRFEGNWAVIEFGRETFQLPKELLPIEAKVGDSLDFHFTVNLEKTTQLKKEISTLANKLFK
jgi:hypothetical protein